MTDKQINYAELMALWEACGPRSNPIVRYEVDEYGGVNLYNEDGSWAGCTTREGLQYLLDNQPCIPKK
jgi:hypothetical protein